MLYPLNIYPSKVNKTFLGKKTEIIHFQQTYVVNVRGSPVRKKMMPDRESNLYKEMKVRNGTHMGKHKIIFLILKIYQRDTWLFKTKIITIYHEV